MTGVRRDRDLRNAPKVREPEAEPEQASLIRKLQINFDELHVAAIANRIVIYESTQLKPIDVSAATLPFSPFFFRLDIGGSPRDHPRARRGADATQYCFLLSWGHQ